MTKHYAIIAAIALTGMSMRAETVTDYVQDFESSCTINTKGYELPGSWGHVAEGYVGENSTYFPTYSWKSTGGIGNSGCIQVSEQNRVGSYNDSWGSAYDLLVTPEVSGTITIDYKRQNSYSDGCFIEFYYLVEENGELTRGELIEVTMPELSYSEYKTVSFELATPQRIGIRASYGYIDHFTASKAEVEKKRQLKIKSTSNTTDGRTSPICNEQNIFKIKSHVKIENNGEADILTTDPDATVSLCWSSDAKGTDAVLLSTVPISADIPVGQTIEMDLEADVDANLYPGNSAYGVIEGVSGTYEWMAWITPNEYKPQFQLLRSNGSQVSASDISNGRYVIDYGRVSGTYSRSYSIKNGGAGPLALTSVEAPEGITVTPTAFTLAYNEKQDITIEAGGENYGPIIGEIKFNIEGADPIAIPVTATLLDPAKYWEGFEECENLKFPADMIVVGPQNSSRWGVENCSSTNPDKPVNNYLVFNKGTDLNNHDRLITPLLDFEAEETFSFDAFKIKSDGNSQISIYRSTDRANWELVKTITKDEMVNPISSTVIATPVSVNMPEGKYYIAVECNYVYIDDLYGGTPADVEYDLYLTNSKTPASGMVNYEYTATLDIRNMLDKAAEAKVALMIDGETVAEEEVEIPALAASVPVSVSYLADTVLEDAEAYFTVTAGETEFKSAVWTVNIRPEQMIAEATVISENTTTRANVPHAMNWYRTMSETVYPKDVLGLTEGEVITSIAYNGYSTISADKTLTIKVWIENCEESTPNKENPTDVATMTQVSDGEKVTLTAKGSSEEPEKMIEVPFSTPFTYNGGNIRIVTLVLLDAYCSGTSYLVSTDDALKNNSIYRNDDKRSFDDGFTSSWYSGNAPVVTFGIKKEPVQITGKIMATKNSETYVVAGAIVTLTAVPEQSEDSPMRAKAVTYTATTDESGEFNVSVLQPGMKYALTASHAKHHDYTHPELIDPTVGDQNVDFNMEYDVTSGVDAVADDNAAEKEIYNMQGVYLGNDPSRLAPGLYIISGKKVIIK